MKNTIFFIAFFFTCFHLTNAQKDSVGVWTKGGLGGITFNQIALSNWAGGGSSNLTLIGNLNLFANLKKGNATWDNSLDLAYGFLKNYQFENFKLPVTKAEDKIDFNSKFGKKAWSEKTKYSAFFNFRTQFAPGYSNPGEANYISKFLSPAYLQFGVGIDYKPVEWFSVLIAPISGKITIVADDSLALSRAFGVNTYLASDPTKFTPGNSKNVRAELGASIIAKAKRDILKNVAWESNLNLFSNYVYNPEYIDVRWTNALVAKVNKYLSVNLFTELLYDYDILIPLFNPDGTKKFRTDGVTQRKGRRLQIKEVFGVGINFKF